MRKITRDIVSALIFSKDKKLFMGMKDPQAGGVYSDCWHIPGGGVDKGENQNTALAREIKEEVGIDISSQEIKLIDDTGSGLSTRKLKDSGETVECKMNFYVYRVNLNDKASEVKISLDDDLVKYEWVEIKDLNKYKLTPPSIELFEKLGYLSPSSF